MRVSSMVSLSFGFSHQTLVCISVPSPACHVPPPLILLQSAPPVVLMKNSFHTPRKTHYVSVTKTDQLTLFREITADYCETHVKCIRTLRPYTAEHFNGKANGKYNYHYFVNG